MSSQPPDSQAQIQPATWRDLNSLRHIEKVCFPKDAWPLWDLIGVLTLPDVIRLKAVCEDKMIGFSAVDLRPSEQTAWIATIGVLPEYRGRGIGRQLLQASEEAVTLRSIRLNVRPTNYVALQLYQDFGYQKIGLWTAYYSDGEDALVMEKLRK